MSSGIIFCQQCKCENDLDEQYCRRCGAKLLVINWPMDEEDEENEAYYEASALNEHILERITSLEESMKIMAERMAMLQEIVADQQRADMMYHGGLISLVDILQNKRILDVGEFKSEFEGRLLSIVEVQEKKALFQRMRAELLTSYRGSNRQAYEDRIFKAGELMKRGAFDEAVRIMTRAFTRRSGNYALASYLGTYHLVDGDTRKARDFIRAALEDNPHHAPSLLGLGRLHFEAGQYASARKCFERVSGSSGSARESQVFLAMIAAAEGRPGRAERLLHRAREEDDYPDLLFLQGILCSRLNHKARAIGLLEQTVEEVPESLESHFLLGALYLRRGWHCRAKQSLMETVGLFTGRFTFRQVLAILRSRTGETRPTSRRRLTGAIRQHLAEAVKHFAGGRLLTCERDLRKALELDPLDMEIVVRYAVLNSYLGQDSEAMILARQALGSDQLPRTLAGPALTAFVGSLRAHGQYDEALRVSEAFLEEPGNDSISSAAATEVAFNLTVNGLDLDRALDLAEQGLKTAPALRKSDAVTVLGWIHAKRGALEQAVQILSRDVGRETDIHRLSCLTSALLLSGRREEAWSLLQNIFTGGSSHRDFKSGLFWRGRATGRQSDMLNIAEGVDGAIRKPFRFIPPSRGPEKNRQKNSQK